MLRFLSGAFFAFVTCGTLTAEPIVSIPETQVRYRGTASNSVEQFQNIKFAHDTSGKRRFAPPEDYTPPLYTVVDAASPGPACPQLQDAMPPFFSEVKEISEDCLSLRIARPAGMNLTSGSKLPVVVWIHGGGVVKGSAYDPHFDPESLIKLSVSDGRPIIYAALNYRLNIFGFPRLDILKKHRSLNLGMRDQRAGFQWIKDNIQAFGGDPERITAFGLSAGGTGISLHPMAYGGKQGVPFQQAWIMSGPPGTALNVTSDATKHHTVAVADKLGCGNLPDSSILNCLREVPMQDLLATAMEYSIANHPGGLFTFIPSLDDDFLPDRQSNLMKAGKFVKGIPIIFGWTQDDGAMNAGPGHLIRNEEDMIAPIKSFAHALSKDQISSLFALYPTSDFEKDVQNYVARKTSDDPDVSIHYFRLSRILRDLLFTCSSIEFGYEMVKHTRASGHHDFNQVRLYDLNQSALTPLWKGVGMPYVGVSHGSDTNYIFNGVFPEGQMSKEDEELAKMMTRNFINFAYTGNPISGSASQPEFDEWPESFGTFDGIADTMPSNLNIQVIGGPYGTGPVALSDSMTAEAIGTVDTPPMKAEEAGTNNWFGMRKVQQALSDVFNFEAMESMASNVRKRQIEKEKLHQRCAYIASLAETLGV